MTTIKSRKARHRRLCNDIADMIRAWVTGSDPYDVKVVIMGESGPDILLYGKAKEQWPIVWDSAGEVKAQEKLNIWQAMEQANKYKGPLWFKRNRSEIYVCMKAKDLFDML